MSCDETLNKNSKKYPILNNIGLHLVVMFFGLFNEENEPVQEYIC